MRYQNIIWDMDGTLLDTLADVLESVNHTMRVFSLPERTREDVRKFVGNGIVRFVELCVPDGRQHPQFDEIAAYFSEYYGKNSRNKTKPYDGLNELLRECVSRGARMGIVSNKDDDIVQELSELHFNGLIKVAIGELPNRRMKPQPDAVFEAMRELGAQQENTVYIGDSEVDVATAMNAGVDCIAVDWGFRDTDVLQKAGADVILHTPEELCAYLLLG
jgi:phosphoglycolate phosphatase